MRTTKFDQIAASAPQDAVAARVTSSGEHYEPVLDLENRFHTDICPRLKRVDRMTPEQAVVAAELVGLVVGRLTVIGAMRANAVDLKSDGTRWVVRCSCGRYEIRRSKGLRRAIRKGTAASHCCVVCNHFEKAKQTYNELGPRPVSDFAGGGK
jgi:hypothetical protein